MAIIAKESGTSSFTPHPEGDYPAVCVDVVDLGMVKYEWKGETKEQHKIDIVFFGGEWKRLDDGTSVPLTARERFTLTLSEMGKLRPFLEGWRGKRFTGDELKGFDVEKLLHAPAYINIQHVEKNGKTYANIITCIRLPKGLEAPEIPTEYVRVCNRTEDGERRGSPFADDDDLPF